MNINLEEQYKMLEQTRMLLNPKIITEKKRMIYKHFKDIDGIDLTNLEQKMKVNIILYRAPLLKIHGSYMTNWSTSNRDDIYIDQEFVIKRENADIIAQQLTHETIHTLCRTDDKKVFGHIENKDYLRGINEAVTQMFTDDIEHNELNEKEDYLFFIKNIMRVMKNLIGIDLLANQFLNNNIEFENKFNAITNNNFEDFAFVINEIYKISKNKFYNSITSEEEDKLNIYQNLMLEFANKLVIDNLKINSNILETLKIDFPNKTFLPSLKIEQLNN